MKKSILFSIAAASIVLGNDYLPLSKISEEKKAEYNFVTLDNSVIKAEEVETQSTIYEDGYESVKNISTIDEVKKVEENVVTQPKVIEEVEKQKTETLNSLPKKDKLILRDEVKLEPKKVVVLQDDVEKTNLELQRNVFFTAQITYSPITAEYTSGGVSSSNDSNVFVPEAQLDFDEHQISAEYFSSENDFASENIDTSWYKGGYRYSYKNAHVGADLNYLVLDKTTKEEKEVFPSLEIDFNHNIENIELSYGAGIGKNNNIDYAYDYFFNAGIKPYALSDASLVAGYKNRTIKDDESKLEFRGPYIGVKSKF